MELIIMNSDLEALEDNLEEKRTADVFRIAENNIEEEHKSKMVEINSSYYSDNVLVDNVILSEELIDEADENKLQLLWVKDSCYYLFNTSNQITESKKENINTDVKEISENSFFNLLMYDIRDLTGKSDEEASTILKSLIDSIIEVEEDKETIITRLQSANKTIQDVLDEEYWYFKNIKNDDLLNQMLKKLNAHTTPKAKEIADYINGRLNIVKDHSTQRTYVLKNNEYVEFKLTDVINICSENFGKNQISEDHCRKVFDYFNEPIEKDYSLIQFDNGTLNTEEEKFYKNKFPTDKLPKMKIKKEYETDFEKAKEEFMKTEIYSINHNILSGSKWSWNEDLWYKVVGALCMPTNEMERMVICKGDSGTGKSTLTYELLRVFTYSRKGLQEIAKNERFTLLECVGKDINFIDDTKDGLIKEIGNLNTVISGNGTSVEVKGRNTNLSMNQYTTPKIVGNGNELPTIVGDGFARRLLMILCPNDFKGRNKNSSIINGIKKGRYDEEIATMINYAILRYFQEDRSKDFLTEEQSEAMNREWDFHSYPLRNAVKYLYIDDIELSELLDEAYNNGLIDNYELINNGKRMRVFLKQQDPTKDYSGSGLKEEIINLFEDQRDVVKDIKRFLHFCKDNKLCFKSQTRVKKKQIIDTMEKEGYYYDNVRVQEVQRSEDGEEVNKVDIYRKKGYVDCINVDRLLYKIPSLNIKRWEDKIVEDTA